MSAKKRRFVLRVIERMGLTAREKPTLDEAIVQIRRQIAEEGVAPTPSVQQGISSKKKARLGLPLLLAALFGFYQAFSRLPQTPPATETVTTEPGTKNMRLSEAASTPSWSNNTSTTSPPIVEQRPSNFVTFRLPRGVELQLPKGWWLLGSEHLGLIATAVEANMDLSGLELPERQKTTLIAANSLPKSSYAAIRINSTTPPSMTRAELAAITAADIAEMTSEMTQTYQKVMQAQGNQLLEGLAVHVDEFAGYPALVTEYRRTGPQGPVWVQLIQVFTERHEIGINLSYRESEAGLWKPVVAKIRQSIVVKPWP